MDNENGNEAEPEDDKQFPHIDYSELPEHMRKSMEGYIEYGHEIGGFMFSILTNDLRGAVKRADIHNRFVLLAWIDFCLGELPSNSWGSVERVTAWMKSRKEHHRGGE